MSRRQEQGAGDVTRVWRESRLGCEITGSGGQQQDLRGVRSRRLESISHDKFMMYRHYWREKGGGMEWVERVLRIGEQKNAYRDVVVRPEGKRSLGTTFVQSGRH